MQNVFFDTRFLDNAARSEFNLTEDSMMECAGIALKNEVECYLNGLNCKQKKVLILCGGGNNGGDGYVLARLLLEKKINIDVCICVEPKSEMCKKQNSLINKNDLRIFGIQDVSNYLTDYCVVVDCIFGSGFHGNLSPEIFNLIKKINDCQVYKIACDIPSGLDLNGNFSDDEIFCADVTVAMGAQKVCYYSSKAKDFIGQIVVADLGVSRQKFESNSNKVIDNKTNYFLLEKSDMILPHRNKKNVNKGSFGHAAIVLGTKLGAGVIAASSAFRFGAGLVSLVFQDDNNTELHDEIFPGKKICLDDEGMCVESLSIVPYDLMCTNKFPENTTAVAIGMGLGRNYDYNSEVQFCYEKKYFNFLLAHKELPCILDADIFYSSELCSFLTQRCAIVNNTNDARIILTPHPKELVSLVKFCLPDIYSKYSLNENGVKKVIDHLYEIINLFCTKFTGVVLLVKGSVVTIGIKNYFEDNVSIYFNPYGTNALAKGGSGDVLSGMICALLAQKYSLLDSAITASLSHAFASANCKCDYALTPFSLMKLVSEL